MSIVAIIWGKACPLDWAEQVFLFNGGVGMEDSLGSRCAKVLVCLAASVAIVSVIDHGSEALEHSRRAKCRENNERLLKQFLTGNCKA